TMGTPLYMPPETWRGEPTLPAADVYSLGALLYQLCTGTPPHAARTIDELRELVFTRSPRPLAEAALVDPELAAVVDRCLRADPAARYASGDDLRDALQELLPEVRRAAIPEGNPYRGLNPFDAEHRALF